MPEYKFRALDAKGKTVSGVMQAFDETDLHNRLRGEGRYLLSAAEKQRQKQRSRALHALVLAEFSRQLGTLIGAGVSLVRAMGILIQEETIKEDERQIYSDVLRLIRQGVALSDAMEAQGGAFPPLMINMYRSAEATGNLDQTAMRMAEHYQKEYRLNSKVKSAMTYPKILVCLLLLVLVAIMTFVIPQFEDLFSSIPEVPWAMRMLMGVSDFLINKWMVLLVILAVAGAVLFFIFTRPAVKMGLSKLRLRLPVIGKLQKIICTARFARTLSSLYSAGIPIVGAMQIAKKTIGNSYVEQQFDQVVPFVRAGGSLSDGLDMIDGFVKKLPSSIRVGEETGSLDEMLDSIADTLDYEAERSTEKLVSYLEPVMILVMAAMVGFILIAVLQGVYEAYGSFDDAYSSPGAASF